MPPQVFNDSPGYLVPALALVDGRGYGSQENGYRSPTYPLFLAAVLFPLKPLALSDCRDAHNAVCVGKAAQTAQGSRALRLVEFAQVGLGLLITALLAATVWYAAVVVSLTNVGDNARYHSYVLPLQYAAIVFIINAGWRELAARMAVAPSSMLGRRLRMK